MSSHHRSPLAALAIVGLAVLGACGDSDGTPDGTPAQRSGSGAPDTTTAGTAVGASGEAVDCAGTEGETVTVDIGDFEFIPDRVSVSACDQIVWSNTHDQAHTSTGSGDVRWSTGNIAPGAEADPIVFDTPGEFAYMCALHPFMKGTVEVA
jgi:plastocyanin